MISSVKTKTNPKTARTQKQIEEDEEEARLSSFFFEDVNEVSNKLDKKQKVKKKNNKYDIFMIDRQGIDGDVLSKGDESEEESVDESLDELGDELRNEKPVWEDEDDINTKVELSNKKRRRMRKNFEEKSVSQEEYQNRLRSQFEDSFSNVGWARVSKKKLNEVDAIANNILCSTESLSSSNNILVPNKINVIRRPDVNRGKKSLSTIRVVQFYRGGSKEDKPLLFTANNDGLLSFYALKDDVKAGTESDLVSEFYVKKYPIYSASFIGKTQNVVFSSRRTHYYIYDSVAQKVLRIPGVQNRPEKSYENFKVSPDGTYIAFLGYDGYILLVSMKTKRLIKALKINGSVKSISFHPTDSNFLLASGGDGDVYRWDLRTFQIIQKFPNIDGTTVFAMETYQDSNSTYAAVGASSGVVNLYDFGGSSIEKKPKHMKSIMNLQTSVNKIQVNHDSQIMAISSQFCKNGLKLCHLKTQSIFANWPTFNTPLHYIFSLDFSPNSRYLTIGNAQGTCLLYEVLHYSK